MSLSSFFYDVCAPCLNSLTILYHWVQLTPKFKKLTTSRIVMPGRAFENTIPSSLNITYSHVLAKWEYQEAREKTRFGSNARWKSDTCVVMPHLWRVWHFPKASAVTLVAWRSDANVVFLKSNLGYDFVNGSNTWL